MNSGRNHKGLKRPSAEVVAKIRRVHAEDGISFKLLGIRFSIDQSTIAKIVKRKYPYDEEA
jgi:hypothetical protein